MSRVALMDLTPEERERIYEEEKARIEARHAIETRTATRESAKRRRTTVVLLLGAVAIVYACTVLTRTQPAPTFSPPKMFGERVKIGEEGHLRNGAAVAADPLTLENWTKALQANDKYGLAHLGGEGRVFWVGPGTRVLVIDKDSQGIRVRLLDGKKVGEAGWVASGDVNP